MAAGSQEGPAGEAKPGKKAIMQSEKPKFVSSLGRAIGAVNSFVWGREKIAGHFEFLQCTEWKDSGTGSWDKKL